VHHGQRQVELMCLKLTDKALQAQTNDGRTHWIPVSAMIQPDFSDFTEGLVKVFMISDWFINKTFDR
jgi:hypothetical protein